MGQLTASATERDPSVQEDEKEAEVGIRMLCHICIDDIVNPVAMYCNHIFCKECIQRKLRERRMCPVCDSTLQDCAFYRLDS